MNKEICVIDDDYIYQLIIEKIIRRAAIFVKSTAYRNAGHAFQLFKDPEFPLPHLILLDINMPLMDGWEFITQLSSCRPNLKNETKIYIVTSSIATADKLKAASFKEISGFLSKPVSVQKLKEIGGKI
jgi:CheY-like chemotaxis protein